MKVLITTDWYKPAINGVVTSVLSLEAGLTALGHEVRILTLSGDSYSHTEGGISRIGSVGMESIYPNARVKTAPGGRCIQTLADWKPDIVHSQCEFSTFLPARKIAGICGCPLVHTYHTVYEDFTHYFSPDVRFGKYMAARFSQKTLEKVQAVIAPTAKIKTMLEGYGVHAPIYVQPSGLRLDAFRRAPNPEERDGLRRSLGIAPDEPVLLYVGRLGREKNAEELITLLSQTQAPRPRLLLVGDGPYRPLLEAEAQVRGVEKSAVFAGMVPPHCVAQYYHIGDIFVSASRSETQGMTYMEAMAAGLPLLCRDDPCLQGVIQNGGNGFVYRSPEEFRKALSTLLSDTALRRTMGERAREAAFSRYSAESFARGVLDIYRQTLEGWAPPESVRTCARGFGRGEKGNVP